MSKRLAWGILGTGNIARQFCVGVNASQRGELVAVGSRQVESARAFASTHRIGSSYGSYDEVLNDRNVQAVYVSLPNALHHEWTIKSLKAGKHVLCEKPFANSLAESQEMFDVAQRTGCVLIEAFMYKSHPLTHAVMRAVREGSIGKVRMVRTSFCYKTSKIQGNVRFSADLAGGVLMDVGCYCISFSRLIAGEEPDRIDAAAHRHPSGVDDIVVGTLRFPSGLLASMTFGMSVQADNTAYVCGSDGYIEIPIPWKPPQRAEFTIAHSTPPQMDNPSVPAPPPRETRYVETVGDLYGIEADAFATTVQDGAPPFVSKQDTLGNMRVLDELRRLISQ